MKYILFDLDSTLYYLDEKNFLPIYFDAIGKMAIEIGYDYEVACHAMYDGSINMSNSDGVKTNEQLFWEAFEKITGPLPKEDRNKFDSYYDTDFDLCGHCLRGSYIACSHNHCRSLSACLHALSFDFVTSAPAGWNPYCSFRCCKYCLFSKSKL